MRSIPLSVNTDSNACEEVVSSIRFMCRGAKVGRCAATSGEGDESLLYAQQSTSIGWLAYQLCHSGTGHMDLRRLELLLQVADFGSFSKAATVLGIAQPALGRQIQKLEEECGVRLFYRHGRGVSPTPAGETL